MEEFIMRRLTGVFLTILVSLLVACGGSQSEAKGSGGASSFPTEEDVIINPSRGLGDREIRYVHFDGYTEFVLPLTFYEQVKDVLVSILDIVETGKMPSPAQAEKYELALGRFMAYSYNTALIGYNQLKIKPPVASDIDRMRSDYNRTDVLMESLNEMVSLASLVEDLRKYYYDPGDPAAAAAFEEAKLADGYISAASSTVFESEYHFFNEEKYPNLCAVGSATTNDMNPDTVWRSIVTKK
jgi:hypothetical protein